MEYLTTKELKNEAARYEPFARLVIDADRRGRYAGILAQGKADIFYQICEELRRRGVNAKKIFGIG